MRLSLRDQPLIGRELAQPLLGTFEPLAQRGGALAQLLGRRLFFFGHDRSDLVPRELPIDAQDQERAIVGLELLANYAGGADLSGYPLDGPFPDDHPVRVLVAKNLDGTLDKEVLEELRRYIHGRHPKQAGLCLSGGGIRSATFGLGVLQSLAKLQLLDKFDYLSTVSGGGYIGSWLTAWMHRHPRGLEGVSFAVANMSGILAANACKL